MKNKISLIIIGLFLVLGVTAQRAVLLSPNLTYYDVRVTAADVATTTGTLTFSAEVNQHVPFTYDVKYALAKVGVVTSVAHVVVSLEAKKFLTDTATEIASATWNNDDAASTSGTFSATTGVRYRYLYLKVVGQSTNVNTRVSGLEWKIWQ